MKYLCRLVCSSLALAGVAFAQDFNFEPVHPDDLIATLPDEVSGYQAAKAEKTMTGEIGSRYTLISRVYTKTSTGWFEDEDEVKPTVTIKITDSAGNKSFAPLHNKLAELGHSPSSNAISVDGHLAITNYREGDQFGMLSLYVADRFIVQIAVKGLEEKEMMNWWQKIDEKKLSALAIPPTPTPVSTPTPASTATHTQAKTP
jgi:hypothetical protein